MPTITSSYPSDQSLTSGRNFGPDMSMALAALLNEERRRRPVSPASAPARRPTDRGGEPIRSGAREGGQALAALFRRV